MADAARIRVTSRALRSLALAGALGIGLGAGIEPAGAAALAQFNNATSHTWPTWIAIPALNDANNGVSTDMDFVGDATNPGFYWGLTLDGSNNPLYLHFRFRIQLGAVSNGFTTCSSGGGTTSIKGTQWIYIDAGAAHDGIADWAIAWDSKSNDPSWHGLEMQIPSGRGATWNLVLMDDADGGNGAKGPQDIQCMSSGDNGNNADGYIQTVDGQSTTNFGTTTFVDIAVSCAYFTRLNGYGLKYPNKSDFGALKDTNLPNISCSDWMSGGTKWNVQIGSRADATDHNLPTTDIGGGHAPTDSSNIWESPTLATVSSLHSHVRDGAVVVEWQTSAEHETIGFHLERLNEATGRYDRLNRKLLPGLVTSPRGGTYDLVDATAVPGGRYTYRLAEVETRGAVHYHGPYSVVAANPATAPVVAKPVRGFTSTARGRSAAQEQRQVSAAQAKAAAKAERTGGTGSQVKIEVITDGLVFVSTDTIARLLGMKSPEVQARLRGGQFAMHNLGLDVAWLAAADGSGLYFYGERLDDIYTGSNIYWLAADKGVQMARRAGTCPAPIAAATTFGATRHFEESHELVLIPGTDYWIWARDWAPATMTFAFHLDGVASAPGSAALTLRLRGISEAVAGNDHHVKVSVNGVSIGETTFDGRSAHDVTLPAFAQSLLKDGDNSLGVELILDPAVPWSIVGVDSFDVSYRRIFHAVGDVLAFGGEGNPGAIVDGFSRRDVTIFDLANPLRPVLVSAPVTGAAGNYQACLGPAPIGRRFLAVTPAGASAPADAWADGPSNLRASNNRGSYLVIATAETAAAARSLAAYRKTQGLDAQVVLLEDVMDEFSYGVYEPSSLATFLRYAYRNWKTPPRYVVLAGAGTYDYHDYQRFGGNLIPPLPIENADGVFPSDSVLGDVDGDGVPDIAVGRLPAVTNAELQAMVDKIIAYEARGGNRPNRVVMVADDPDPGLDFPHDSDAVAATVPAARPVEKIYLGKLPIDAARAQLIDSIRNGAYLVNYIGHGNVFEFAGEGLLTSDDVASLTVSPARQPIMAAMTCQVANFALPGYNSIGELLILKPDGGVPALWAPTGLSYNDDAAVLDREFFRAVFVDGRRSIGDAVLQAEKRYRAAGRAPYLLQLYSILGDPAMRLW